MNRARLVQWGRVLQPHYIITDHALAGFYASTQLTAKSFESGKRHQGGSMK
jgi:hypothetical protein